MTDKVHKIKDWISKEQDGLMDAQGNFEYPEHEGAYHILCNLDAYIDSLQEEPVNDDLREAARKYFKSLKDYCFISSDIMLAFKAGAKWQEENLWKPADGDDLPEYEREVVVFTQNFPDDAGIMSVAIGHRPNPDGWDGKSLSTGKVEHYTPKTYDKGGWNIPDIVYWLDVKLPKEIEL